MEKVIEELKYIYAVALTAAKIKDPDYYIVISDVLSMVIKEFEERQITTDKYLEGILAKDTPTASKHNRHPYTYAADWLRELVGAGDGKPAGAEHGSCILSRTEASRIRQEFCKILGLDDREAAYKLSLHFQKMIEER